MNKHIVKTKNAIPASSETQDLAMQLLRGELDSYIEEIKEKKGIKDTEREEQYKKLFRILKKYFSENHNKERGIKAFTLNDSVFFTIALLNNFKFQYLTITDTAKVCNVLFDYDAETVRKRMHDFRKEKKEQSDFNPKVNQQINGLIKKVEHLLGTGRDNQAKLKELKEWLYSNVMSKNNLWNEDTKE